MTDLCPGCGLDLRERDLIAFLRARLAEHVDEVERHAGASQPIRRMAVAASDLALSVRTVVDLYARSSPERREALRFPLLILTQTWVEHPDYAPEWREALGG